MVNKFSRPPGNKVKSITKKGKSYWYQVPQNNMQIKITEEQHFKETQKENPWVKDFISSQADF